jgi:ICE2 protein
MASYSTFMHFVSTLPSTVLNFFHFVSAAFMTVTPSVLISLIYRTSVMLASARIIPAVRESGARALTHPPSLEDSDEAGRLLAFLGVFAPTILVSVYTSLLMQHFEAMSGSDAVQMGWWASQGGSAGGNLWRWINLAFTMAIYSVELYLGRGAGEHELTHHWHTD